jgi:MFS superfamily sulfate permease-like transporter
VAQRTNAQRTDQFRFDVPELAGAVADLGVLVPISVALIVKNGLAATAVLLPAGALYVAAGFLYRVPVPVQPLKAFGAIAIARGLGTDEIAAGALLMGAIFLVLGASGFLDLVARAFPRPIIRGIQLSVGLLFLRIAWGLLTKPSPAFADHTQSTMWLVAAGAVVAVAAVALRRHHVTLGLVAVAVVAIVIRHHGAWAFGPSAVPLPHLTVAAFTTAFTALVVPQLPLSFANSCLATADAARAYFGERAVRVRPGRLAVSLGTANLLAGAIGGMPVCHGAGGMTAHRSFGARTGGAPVAMGVALLALAVGLGSGLRGLLAGFPLPILAGLLSVAGALHITLLRDLRRASEWGLALVVGLLGFYTNLSLALLAGLALWWATAAVRSASMKR